MCKHLEKLLLFFGFFFVISITNANSTKQFDNSLLVGKWKNTFDQFVTYYDIKSDGFFYGQLYKNGELVMESEGTWEIINSQIKWEHKNSFPKELTGHIDYDELLDLSDNSFLIKGDNGEIRKYYRLTSTDQPNQS